MTSDLLLWKTLMLFISFCSIRVYVMSLCLSTILHVQSLYVWFAYMDDIVHLGYTSGQHRPQRLSCPCICQSMPHCMNSWDTAIWHSVHHMPCCVLLIMALLTSSSSIFSFCMFTASLTFSVISRHLFQRYDQALEQSTLFDHISHIDK